MKCLKPLDYKFQMEYLEVVNNQKDIASSIAWRS